MRRFHNAVRNQQWYAKWNRESEMPLNVYKDGTSNSRDVSAVSFSER